MKVGQPSDPKLQLKAGTAARRTLGGHVVRRKTESIMDGSARGWFGFGRLGQMRQNCVASFAASSSQGRLVDGEGAELFDGQERENLSWKHSLWVVGSVQLEGSETRYEKLGHGEHSDFERVEGASAVARCLWRRRIDFVSGCEGEMEDRATSRGHRS